MPNPLYQRCLRSLRISSAIALRGADNIFRSRASKLLAEQKKPRDSFRFGTAHHVVIPPPALLSGSLSYLITDGGIDTHNQHFGILDLALTRSIQFDRIKSQTRFHYRGLSPILQYTIDENRITVSRTLKRESSIPPITTSGMFQPGASKTIRWHKAYEFMLDRLEKSLPLDWQTIETINAILRYDDPSKTTDNADDGAPFYRTYLSGTEAYRHGTEVMGEFMPPERFHADKNIVIQTAYNDRWHPLIKAAKAYQDLITLHPFGNGNGRTAFIVLDWILMSHGLPPPLFDSIPRVENFYRFIDRNEFPSIIDPPDDHVLLSKAVAIIKQGILKAQAWLEEEGIPYTLPDLDLPNDMEIDKLTYIPYK